MGTLDEKADAVETAKARMRADLDLSASVVALVALLRDKGILSDEDVDDYNKKKEEIHEKMFCLSDSVVTAMHLLEEDDSEHIPRIMELMEKASWFGEELLAICGKVGAISDLREAMTILRQRVEDHGNSNKAD